MILIFIDTGGHRWNPGLGASGTGYRIKAAWSSTDVDAIETTSGKGRSYLSGRSLLGRSSI
jgi:hypothetical protein